MWATGLHRFVLYLIYSLCLPTGWLMLSLKTAWRLSYKRLLICILGTYICLWITNMIHFSFCEALDKCWNLICKLSVMLAAGIQKVFLKKPLDPCESCLAEQKDPWWFGPGVSEIGWEGPIRGGSFQVESARYTSTSRSVCRLVVPHPAGLAIARPQGCIKLGVLS
jgi:hypothetical protein